MIQETLNVDALPPVRVQLHNDVQLMDALTFHDAVKTPLSWLPWTSP